MKLQRPTLEDKDAILEMIAEFDAAKSYMHGGMGSEQRILRIGCES